MMRGNYLFLTYAIFETRSSHVLGIFLYTIV